MGETKPAEASPRRKWRIVRIVMYMLKRGLLKHKPTIDLPHMMKKGKGAGKAIGDLVSSPNSGLSGLSCRSGGVSVVPYAPREYEFSCSSTPAYTFPFHNTKRNKHPYNYKHYHRNQKSSFFSDSTHTPLPPQDEFAADAAFHKALEWLNSDLSRKDPSRPPPAPISMSATNYYRVSPTASPYPLRITDSPFPLKNEEDDDHRIDKEAEDFIARFYEQLQSQKQSEARFRDMIARGAW